MWQGQYQVTDQLIATHLDWLQSFCDIKISPFKELEIRIQKKCVAPLAAEDYDIKQVLKNWRIIICPIHSVEITWTKQQLLFQRLIISWAVDLT